MNTRTVQRSPNLGLGIRMQRLQPVSQAVQQAFTRPRPPWWWGWMDVNGQPATVLDVLWDAEVGPGMPNAYWPGMWVAVVEGATVVRWEVEFTPKVWFKGLEAGAKTELMWEGKPIALQLPAVLPAAPEELFTPAKATLPDPLKTGGSDVSPWVYWDGAYSTPGFPNVSVPQVIAAGNTLSVAQDTKSMSGSLVAQAFVDDVSAGSVWLDLMREIPKVWS